MINTTTCWIYTRHCSVNFLKSIGACKAHKAPVSDLGGYLDRCCACLRYACVRRLTQEMARALSLCSMFLYLCLLSLPGWTDVLPPQVCERIPFPQLLEFTKVILPYTCRCGSPLCDSGKKNTSIPHTFFMLESDLPSQVRNAKNDTIYAGSNRDRTNTTKHWYSWAPKNCWTRLDFLVCHKCEVYHRVL